MKQLQVSKSALTGIFALVIIAIMVFLFQGAFEDCDKSKIYVNQYPFTGNYAVWTEGGLQPQYWGNIYEYSKTTQVEFTGAKKNDDGYVADGENPAAAVTFNDKGRGFIIGSLRVVLPIDFEHMSKIQQDFGSEQALISTLVRPTLYKVVTSCGPLMSSLESVSETRTDLIQYITDQLNNGVYKTKIKKVEVVNELTGDSDVVAKAELISDGNAPGGFKRQEVSPFSQYGITCNLVSITDIKYDKATQDQIDAQKGANLAVITSKTKSLEAIQKTILVTEQGKQAAETAKWEQEKEKARAVTKAQQEFEVAKLEAEKAEQVARKVRAEGEAKAAANRALVSAGLTPLEKATIEKETAIGVAQALANSNVQWVPSIMIGGSGSNSNAMDAVGLNMMMDIVKKMNK
jgi:ribosomal protein S11